MRHLADVQRCMLRSELVVNLSKASTAGSFEVLQICVRSEEFRIFSASKSALHHQTASLIGGLVMSGEVGPPGPPSLSEAGQKHAAIGPSRSYWYCTVLVRCIVRAFHMFIFEFTFINRDMMRFQGQ